MKSALVYGATGQLGSYLVDLLHGKDYVVYEHEAHFDDVEREGSLLRSILVAQKPDEIYNFAAKMYAPDSWNDPMEYMKVNGLFVLKMMDTIFEFLPSARVFQAGSAEVFDKGSIMQSEDTNRLPENPYGLAKMVAMEAVRIYREQKGLFACTGIFFNAESPRRKDTFFAKRAASEAVRIKSQISTKGRFIPAHFGRLEARRDWGWAPEYVEVAWKMLQLDTPYDFVIGTGESHTCREFVLECLLAAGLSDAETKFDEYVKYEKVKEYQGRDTMRAVPEEAKRRLGWQAQYKFKEVVSMLVAAAMEQHSRKSLPRDESLALNSGLTPTTK